MFTCKQQAWSVLEVQSWLEVIEYKLVMLTLKQGRMFSFSFSHKLGLPVPATFRPEEGSFQGFSHYFLMEGQPHDLPPTAQIISLVFLRCFGSFSITF